VVRVKLISSLLQPTKIKKITIKKLRALLRLLEKVSLFDMISFWECTPVLSLS